MCLALPHKVADLMVRRVWRMFYHTGRVPLTALAAVHRFLEIELDVTAQKESIRIKLI